MELEPILNDFECYRQVQRIKGLDNLLTDYLITHELAVSDGEPNQGREVRLMRDKPDLSSRSVIFHEKCEIGLYLGLFATNLGFKYTEDEVRNGTAHKQNYIEAHNVAESIELALLQHVAMKVSGRKIPFFAILPTRPVIQIFDPEFKVAKLRMGRYLPNNSFFRLYAGTEEFVPLKFNPEDVQASFEMFERFGSEYHTPDFKDRCLTAVKNFVRSTNIKYESLQESMRVRVKQAPTF
ncbi:MAG: hypothetical protein Q8P57_05105 [Candidatus Pacearchaeota archaeon]|nr:hypothetical protein [Candidatus Pacearchaeota archaeon]